MAYKYKYKPRYLAVERARIARMPPCTVSGCSSNQRCKGLCSKHYDAFIRKGSTDTRPQRKSGTGTISRNGYKLIHTNGKQRLEHVLVAEKALGKKLPEGALVHHVDRNKLNNDPRNLVVCPDDAYHRLLHQRQDALDACGHAHWRRCRYCREYDLPENLYVMSGDAYHSSCRAKARRALYAEMKAAGIPASARIV